MEQRPNSFTDALRGVVDFLNLGDKAFEAIVTSRGEITPISGNSVQRDLLAFADMLESDPELNARIVEKWNQLPSS